MRSTVRRLPSLLANRYRVLMLARGIRPRDRVWPVSVVHGWIRVVRKWRAPNWKILHRLRSVPRDPAVKLLPLDHPFVRCEGFVVSGKQTQRYAYAWAMPVGNIS
jgi:hypothetical protein